jgi:hypothetical protein
MMALALRYLLARPALLVCLGLLLATGIFGGVQTVRLSLTRTELAELRSELELAQKEQARAEAEGQWLRRDLATQTAAVQQWKAEADLQAQRAEQAGRTAAQIRTVTRTRVVQLMREPVPSDCDGAVQWGLQQALELGQAWEAGQ